MLLNNQSQHIDLANSGPKHVEKIDDKTQDTLSYNENKDNEEKTTNEDNSGDFSWWLFNPFSYFNIRKNFNSKKNSKASLLLSNRNRAAETGQSSSSPQIQESPIVDDRNNTIKEKEDTNVDNMADQYNNDNTADQVEISNASNFEDSLNLPPRLNLDLTKKEIPKSTIESMSPTYRLIKEAFSEFQLFSKACKQGFKNLFEFI